MVEFQIMGLVLTERIPILKNDGTMNELTYYHDPPRRQMRRASSLSNVFIPNFIIFEGKSIKIKGITPFLSHFSSHNLLEATTSKPKLILSTTESISIDLSTCLPTTSPMELTLLWTGSVLYSVFSF